MRGVWKHIHHTCGLQHIAVLVDQNAKVAGQTAGMTGNLTHALRRQPGEER